jgi:hypothetical protein
MPIGFCKTNLPWLTAVACSFWFHACRTWYIIDDAYCLSRRETSLRDYFTSLSILTLGAFRLRIGIFETPVKGLA